MAKPVVTKKDWTEFRESGLVLVINQLLHIFGWVICFEIDSKTNEVTKCYPARTRYRGFSEEDVDESHKKVSQYLKDNIDDIYEEAQS